MAAGKDTRQTERTDSDVRITAVDSRSSKTVIHTVRKSPKKSFGKMYDDVRGSGGENFPSGRHI